MSGDQAVMMVKRIDTPPDRPFGALSKMVGLYQMFLRRLLEHFFPDAILETVGDRSFIDWDATALTQRYTMEDDPDGLGVRIDWFRTRYLFQPSSPTPFLDSERRLIEMTLRALEFRFLSITDPDASHRVDRFNFPLEDLIVTDYLDAEEPSRIPAALEALRVAALTTYENRRVSTGALLLGTDDDPAEPGREPDEEAPRFNARLTAIKGFHRLCDGVRTLFQIDLDGAMSRAIDIERWAKRVHGDAALDHPCPRAYVSHAKATRDGGHVCVVLTPSQEIKVFAGGVMTFAFSDARWRLLDIPTKFAVWCRAVGGGDCPTDLARRLFQAGLNLSEDRKGGLFVVLRDPEASIPNLIAPADRMTEERHPDEPLDPETLSPRLAKRTLRHAVRGQGLFDMDPSILEAIAGLDGAVVTDLDGRLLTFGAILRIGPDVQGVARAVEGARTLAAVSASFHGPVLKVSEDGFLTMYLGGRRLWEL